MERRCRALVLRLALFEECQAPLRADGSCELGHTAAEQAVPVEAAPVRATTNAVERKWTGPPRYHYFSVDDHIIEPADTWSSRVPAKFRGGAPHVVEEDGREFWEYDGRRGLTMGLNAVAGKPRDQWTMDPVRFSDMIPGCYDPVARAADMRADGVVASVCFPTLPRFGGALFNEFSDKALADACVQAYNDFIFEEWCAAAPELFVPMVITQLWDPQAAAAEIRRNADRGARAVAMPEETSLLGLPGYYDDSWDPVWEAVTETDVAVCMHIGSSGWGAYVPPGAPFALNVALGCLGAFAHSVALLMSPVPRKFPSIKFVLSEGGVGWVPSALERADRHWIRGLDMMGQSDVGILPSEIAAQNFWWCLIEEPFALRSRHEIGVTRLLWECDYPHTDSTWPNSQAEPADLLDTIPADEAELITRANAEGLFRWKCHIPDPVGAEGS